MTTNRKNTHLKILSVACVIGTAIVGYNSFNEKPINLYVPTIDNGFSKDLLRIKNAKANGEWHTAYQLLKTHAKTDNPFAKLEYARLYLKGWGTKRDLESARLLLLQAVQYDFRERAQAAYELGKVYRLSKGPDCARIAFEWFSKAVKWGYLKAHDELGKAYARGYGVKTDYDLAIKHYSLSIENGSTSVIVALFEVALLQQKNGNADPARGMMLANQYLPLLEIEARNDNRVAARALGRIYDRGLFVKPDISKAFKWFALASANGDAIAMHDLALLGLENKTKLIKFHTALDTLKESAKLGYPAAMTALGRLYLKNKKIRNIEKAINYLENGSRAGHAGSMSELAKLYFEGKFVPQNIETAKNFALKGAAQKHLGSRKVLLKIEALEKELAKNNTKTGKV